MLFWDFYPQDKKSELLYNIAVFYETQFKSRLVRALDSPNLNLNEFWYLVKDLLAGDNKGNESSLFLGLIPTAEQFQIALNCGLKFDAASTSVVLDHEVLSEYIKPVYALNKKRYSVEPPHDPVLKSLNLPYSTYTSQAQQEAVRTALSSKADATVIINLPTGCGKTLVAETLTAFSQTDELSIVIVPTTALALDQARRMKTFIQDLGFSAAPEYAWRGDLKPDVKVRIKADILSGQQRVLFVSPESMVGSLLPTLFKVTKSLKLKNVIFDEAHLIDTWGESFRPEFQKVGAFLNSLRDIGGVFRTVFLSATFSEQTLTTINTLYGRPEKHPVFVNGAFLRPELITRKTKVTEDTYFDEITGRILSSPKPLIVYGATKADCRALYQRLTGLDIVRVSLFTGDTVDDDRKRVIRNWSENTVDIIVATSAFGVGMDKSDVRTVIHAGISENIDSFYQEIGRSGRDGKAAYCEVIYHAKQLDRQSQNKKISTEVGFSRWLSMWKRRKEVSEGIYQVFVNTQANHIERNTDANETWNWKTLLMMQRAGLIRLSYPDVSSIPSEKEEQASFWEDYSGRVLVETLHDRHVVEDTWESIVESHRKQEIAIERQRVENLLSWINGQTKLCSILQQSYQLNGYMPINACATCDVLNNTPGRHSLVGQRVRVTKSTEDFPENRLFYFDSSNKTVEDIIKAFRRALLDERVTMLVCSESFLKGAEPYLKKIKHQVWFYAPLSDYLNDKYVLNDYSKFIIQDDINGLEVLKLPDDWQEKHSNIFVASAQLGDPKHPHRKWWESDNSIQPLSFIVNS
ncbi:protein DpdF [Shewanella sp. Isolate11]|uniref:protein DpdF n=1 Tax=Shewanella sp. Isolate11 TaxID=2908530 RepID=UPI001EFE193B|nr:protein DpdF [Shewanella sp. Isolate11]MCG9698014.1 DEAD/DEAH box helicase [Shewanella sp. Isolate11]